MRRREQRKATGELTKAEKILKEIEDKRAEIHNNVVKHERVLADYRNQMFMKRHEFDDPRHGRILVTQHVYNLIEKEKRESCPQRTPEWLKKRRSHITASQMAAVCNANPYESRSSAFKKKVGVQKPFKGNAATEHGNKWEQYAIELYESRTNQKCLEFGLLESMNEGEEFLAGSPDGITATGRLIEVKCPLMRTPTHEIPSYYRYQIQFLMHILRLPDCDFIQFVPGTDFTKEVFIVTREKYNPYFWYENLPAMVSFWDGVVKHREEHGDGNSDATMVIDIDKTEDEPPKPRRRRVVAKPPVVECEITITSADDGKSAIAEMPARPMSPVRYRRIFEREVDSEDEECLIDIQ